MLFAVLFIRTVEYVLRMFSIIPACALCDVLSAVFFVRAVEYILSIASSFDAAHFFGTVLRHVLLLVLRFVLLLVLRFVLLSVLHCTISYKFIYVLHRSYTTWQVRYAPTPYYDRTTLR